MRRSAVAGLALASATSIALATTGGAAMAEPTPQASPEPAGVEASSLDAAGNPVRPNLTAPKRSQARDGLTKGVVPGRYIVKLKNGKAAASTTRSTVKALTKANGGKVRKVFTGALRGYSAQLTPAEAKRLAADPDVAYVEPVRKVSASGTQTNPPSWGLDRIDQTTPALTKSYTYPSSSGVTAYIIDSGININHQDFGGRASSGFDAVDGGDAADCNGHGTHVAGTVGGTTYGVAKDVDLVAVRVLDCEGYGSTEGVVAGIDWVTNNAQQPAVANMSLGGDVDPVLDDAIATSIGQGITYVVAAGNEADDACAYSPARAPAAITVGATDRVDMMAGFSNYGTCLDTFAPGVGITSAWIGGTTATETINGTSMAAPHVAGIAAQLLAQNPNWTPQQVRNAVVTNGVSGAVLGPAGSIDRLAHVGATPVSRDNVGLRARVNDSLVVAESGGAKPLIARSWQLGGWEKFDIRPDPAGSGMVTLKSKANGKFVAADGGGSKPLIAKSTSVSTWELFQLVHNTDGSVSLKAKANGKYVAADGAGSKPLLAKSASIGAWEKFDLEAPNPIVSVKAKANGKFVAADGGGSKPLLARSTSVGSWEKYELVDLGYGWIAFRALVNNKYVTAQSGGSQPLLAKAGSISDWEAFYVGWHHPDGTVHLYANANGKIVKADSGGSKPLIAKSTSVGAWEQFTIGLA
ncbi:Peptidase inhibitor I9 [Micromonospora haikouensis]|uniref:Peptidase inhibitor I9 n=1 Tax=Micromonospora haikouensis TaxID=686309 RepID=A0A1C4UG57_9ACTN|nr:S8 family serine peptidase [Micromonospora haikouensis]SCE70643.1 Peptidase inhibitor I9 [Micromonospora haikouensis]